MSKACVWEIDSDDTIAVTLGKSLIRQAVASSPMVAALDGRFVVVLG